MPQRNENTINLDDLDENEFILKETQKDELIKEWKRANEMLLKFWENWQKEYLNQLRERKDKHSQKVAKRNYSPTIGEIVLVQDKNIPKNYWQMGKIVELVKSKDGLIRSAKIKSKGKILTRAIALLYPLELFAETENKEKEFKNEEKILSQKGKEKTAKENIEKGIHPMKLRARKNQPNYNENEIEEEDIHIMYYTDESDGEPYSEEEESDDSEYGNNQAVEIERAINRGPIPVNRGLFIRVPEDPIEARIKRKPIVNNKYNERRPLTLYCICPCKFSKDEECYCVDRTHPCTCYPIPDDPIKAKEFKNLHLLEKIKKVNPFKESIEQYWKNNQKSITNIKQK
uniref:DUF5641 domain-containing protein n=1 Tax=Meloidogyne enterolobii TaxID=390850 RepID=A0A6V7W7X5_MELEN|nr:unnamed protein product [Meloidogyne enterolobii]